MNQTYDNACLGFPPRQVVCSLTSCKLLGSPGDVYVGVNDGNQKSGSLCFNASACSFSIWRNAASSASSARFSTVDESNVNFRLSGRDAFGRDWHDIEVDKSKLTFGLSRRCRSFTRCSSKPQLTLLKL